MCIYRLTGGTGFVLVAGHRGPSHQARLLLESAEQRSEDRRDHRGQTLGLERRAPHAEQPSARTDSFSGLLSPPHIVFRNVVIDAR